MGSPTESSILSKLESSTDLAHIHALFSDFLRPFHPYLPPLSKASSSKPPQNPPETAALRTLAKQFLPFLNNSLSLLPRRLSAEAQSSSPDKISLNVALKLFDAYRLCIDCLRMVSPQLMCDPHAIQVQQVRLVSCLVAWGLYEMAQAECLPVLQSLRGANRGKKGVKSMKSKEDEEGHRSARLVVEMDVTLVKCASMVRSKNMADYERVLDLVDEVAAFSGVFDADAYDKFHRMLVGHLDRIAVKLVEESACFDLRFVCKFCKVTFSQYGKSNRKDQMFEFARRLCGRFFSKKRGEILSSIGIIQIVLMSLAAECKFKVEGTVTEFLEFVHDCAKCSRATTSSVCRTVGEYLSKLAGSQVIPIIGPIVGLYASALSIFSYDFNSIIGEPAIKSYAKGGCRCVFLDREGLLQDLIGYLDSMKQFFDVGGTSIGLSGKGTSYLLPYYNALKFLCHPLAKFIYEERKEILADGSTAAFINNLGVIQDAFEQLCHTFIYFTSTGERSNASDDITKVIHSVIVASFTLSLKTGHHIKENGNLVKYVISSDWVQDDGLKYFFKSLYNISVVLYKNKQVKEASKALKFSCKACWNLVEVQCNSHKFQHYPSENYFKGFREEAVKFINEACEKTAFLLDLLFEGSLQRMEKLLKDSLERWSIAESTLKSIPPPLALVNHWVQLEYKLWQNVDAECCPTTLYNLLSSSLNVSKTALGVLLEQELLSYKAMRAVDKRFSQKMQMEVIDILLEKIYISSDTFIQKSRILIAKGGELRECGSENLDECIRCLSDAISVLERFSGHSECDSQVLHLRAYAYCLRAFCTHERSERNSKTLLLQSFEDIRNAINLWLNPYQSDAVNQGNTLDDLFKFFNDNDCSNMLFEDMIKMLHHILDFLSIKGYMEIHGEIYDILICLFKWKDVALEKTIAFFWKSRSGLALCASPMSEVFVSKLLQHYGQISTSIGFWIKCMQSSEELLAGFLQRFFFMLPASLISHFKVKNLEGSLEEVKIAASDLISRVPVSGNAVFVAAYLYYDLSERLITKGKVLEALFYAKESLQLRNKLFDLKFRYSVHNENVNGTETEEGTQRNYCILLSFQLHNSVAKETWFGGPPFDIDNCIPTPWSVLQCYLESTLQVSKIYEILGFASEAESLLLWGKEIALHQCLPLYVVSFSSMLGKLYCKKMLWHLAEKELKAASQIMSDNCNLFSCKKSSILLEATIYQEIGELHESRSLSNIGNPSVEISLANENYRSALQKLNLLEWEGSSMRDSARSSSFDSLFNNLDTRVHTSEIERADGKTQTKRSRNIKKDEMPSFLQGQCLVAGHNLRMTRSRYRSLERACESISCNVQCGPEVKSSDDKLLPPSHGLSQRELASDAKTSLADCLYEITCLCKKIRCWHCLVFESLESGSLTDFVHMNWEFFRRRILLQLLTKIGKCYGACEDNHKAHRVVLLSLSLLVDPFCQKYSSISWKSLIDLISEDFPRDILAIEHAMLLYSICWISLQSYSDKLNRGNGCQISCIGIPRIFSWLKLAFALCCEVPLLCQKVTKLLTVLYVLSTSNKAFSLSTGEALSESYWASFFHQASIGHHFNQRLFSSMMEKTKGGDMIDHEGSYLSSSNSAFWGSLDSLRLTTESLQDMDEFVLRFFERLPSIAVICISVIVGADAILLRKLLGCASAQAWILLSRLNSKSQPVIVLLPLESILEDAPIEDLGFSSGISTEGKNCVQKWRCPWVSTVIDEIAPIYKTILKENFLSSVYQPEDRQSRLLWWSLRQRLDDYFCEFLHDLEESWLGPWKYLLLGELLDNNHMSSLEKKLMEDLMLKCEVKVQKDLLKVILSGAKYSSELRACGLQLILNKGCYVGGCCEAVSNASVEVKSLSVVVFKTILDTCAFEETERLGRKPAIFVLDSEVQMLPWESLPTLTNEEVYRMPSVISICATLDGRCNNQELLAKRAEIFPVIDPFDSFYVLNPSGDLYETQSEFEKWFKDQKIEGKSGEVPTYEELAMALKIHDLFIYLGHGSGSQYFPGFKIQKLSSCAAAILMGCNSGSLSWTGSYAPNGAPLSYLLAGSPATVANLWEVTDKDIDRFCKTMLEAWFRERSVVSARCHECDDELLDKFRSLNVSRERGNGKEKGSRNKSHDSFDVTKSITCKHTAYVGSFMGQARKACKLPFLNGASAVCYGVPTGIAKKK